MGERLGRRLHSLGRRTLREMFWRARTRGYKWLENRGMGLAGLSDDHLLGQLDIPPATMARGQDGVVEHFRRRWAHPWLTSSADHGPPEPNSFTMASSEQRALCAIADDACAGQFRLLGYHHLNFGTPIDWHYDPVHDRRAPLRHWSRIRYLDMDEVGDHKIVWELNRQQFLVTLGQAYVLTGEERYARAALGYVTDWIAGNPPCRGINWCSSLEVGFRAIAWLWCLRHIVHADAISATALRRILATLIRHGLHVERYLSTYFSPNTHLTGEALALLYLGALMPEAGAAARWRERAVGILESELQRQVWDDGVYFEKSTWYQRYTVDIYLHATVLRGMVGHEAPVWWKQRLTRALEVLSTVARPDGTIPLIGDDDGGCLVNLEAVSVCDVRPTIALGARVLDLPGHVERSGPSPTVSWMLGPGGTSPTVPSPGGAVGPVRAFPNGGLYVFREGQNANRSTLLVDAGPHGCYGHAHAGALAFDLTIGREPVITDPGTFAYVGPGRDEFRAGSVHSTVTLDGEGSSTPDGPFSWRDRTSVEVEEWTVSGDSACLRARQEGWRESRKGAAWHERTIVWLMEGCWVICDRVRDPAARSIGIALQAGRNVVAETTGPDSATFRTQGDQQVQLSVTGSVVPILRVEDGAVSGCYGSRQAAPRLRISTPSNRSDPRNEVILLLTFTQRPHSLVRRHWQSAERRFAAGFSSGREVHLAVQGGGLTWNVVAC